MVMDVVQVRLSSGLVEKVDELVETGLYSNRSDVIRDAVRKLVLDSLVGILPNKGDSVKELRKLRNKLSKEIKSFEDLDEINKLVD